jgi:hypothetical protein
LNLNLFVLGHEACLNSLFIIIIIIIIIIIFIIITFSLSCFLHVCSVLFVVFVFRLDSVIGLRLLSSARK